MIIYPAIDIKNGNCVRLLKGEENSETVFSDDPVSMAKKWESSGAGWIHVVDLDGAFGGKPRNFELIKKMVSSVDCNIQLGGGIRNLETADNYIKAGVDRLIIGTAAFSDEKFLSELCSRYPGMVAVGIDTKGGKIAVKGWTEVIDDTVDSVIDRFHELGVSLIINTNVDRDGTMEGVDPDSVREFVENSKLPVIASGGFANMSDLESVSRINSDNLDGVILGKSLYTNSIDLAEAVKRYN